MSGPLEGLREKAIRADMHIRSFKQRAQGFLNSNAYRVMPEPYGDGSQAKVRLFLQVPFPAGELAVILGDAVHNLRATLNHLAWALAVQHQGFEPTSPLHNRCWWKKVNFPVTKSPRLWADEMLGIAPSIRAKYGNKRPFPSWQPEYPLRHDDLLVLEELWNRDKHRALVLVLGHVRLSEITPTVSLMLAIFGLNGPPSGFPNLTRKFYGPIKNNKVIAHADFGHPLSIPEMQIQLNQYTRRSLDIVFGKGMPTEDRSVFDWLTRTQAAVNSILGWFGPLLFEGRYPLRACSPPCSPKL
jgi:hypothetical protein